MNADLWLKKAAEDLSVARLVWDEGHYSHTCFLSQQCIEKNLKGLNYLGKRAKRGSREKMLAVLAKAPDVEPEEYDRL